MLTFYYKIVGMFTSFYVLDISGKVDVLELDWLQSLAELNVNIPAVMGH